MKILYLTDFVPRYVSGPANAVPPRIIAQAQVDEVFWLSINDYFEWQSDAYKFDFGAEWKTRNLADIPFAPDIIVFQGVYSWLKNSSYPKDARKKNIPYVILPHSQLNFQARNMNPLMKILGTPRQFEVFVHYAKAVQFFTEEQKSESNYFGAPTIIIPNGVEPQDIIKRKFKNKINAMFIGRVTDQKGLDLFIEACANVKDVLINKNFTLNVYGSNSNALAALVEKKGLQNIIKLHNPIFGEDKVSAFKNANMFVLPSRYEGQSVALLEALSYSLPILTTTAANMTKKITDAQAGFVADISVESIQQNLIAMLNDLPTKFEAMSNAAYELSRDYFWWKIAKDTHKIYSDLINKE